MRNPALQYYRDIKLLHRYHPEYNVTLAPGADFYVRHFNDSWRGRFTINSLGFRGSPEPDPARAQLACLGDSLVMGFGVSDEETFCYQLNDIVLGGSSYQAINLGVDAFGSLGSALRLEESATKPGMNLKVALFFPSPNDFSIPEELARQGVQPDDVTDAVNFQDEEFKFWFRLQFEATRYSYFLMAAKLSLAQLRVRWAVTKLGVRNELAEAGFVTRSGHPEDARPFTEKLFTYLRDVFYRGPRKQHDPSQDRDSCPEALPGHIASDSPCLARAPDPETLEPLLDVTERAYARMLATARREGFQLVVVLLPIQAETLYCTNQDKYSEFFNFGLRSGRWFAARGVPIVDLRKFVPRMCSVKSYPDGSTRYERRIRDYFIPADGHLTVTGNAWAARALREELRRLDAAGELRSP